MIGKTKTFQLREQRVKRRGLEVRAGARSQRVTYGMLSQHFPNWVLMNAMSYEKDPVER